MTIHATADATRRFASRFAATAAPGYFREPVGCGTPAEAPPMMSSLGIGTYLGEPDAATDAAYTAAVVAAVEGGINVVDSAINYRFQRSERSIGAAIKELEKRGFSREEIVLCTKGGFLTPDGVLEGDPHAYLEKEYLLSGILDASEIAAGCHAMAPKFIADQLRRSQANLGVDCVDIYYLHNPETQLGELSRDDFNARTRLAFEYLESACAAGAIRFYGMATWNGFRQLASAKDYLSLTEMDQLAREVAGGAHHFRFVQLPINFAMTEALTRANQPLDGSVVTMVEAAEALGISIIASASLLQGKMLQKLPPFIAESLGLENDAQRAVQFVRSCPSVKTALIGMSKVPHVQENLRLVSQPTATAEQFAGLFNRGKKS